MRPHAGSKRNSRACARKSMVRKGAKHLEGTMARPATETGYCPGSHAAACCSMLTTWPNTPRLPPAPFTLLARPQTTDQVVLDSEEPGNGGSGSDGDSDSDSPTPKPKGKRGRKDDSSSDFDVVGGVLAPGGSSAFGRPRLLSKRFRHASFGCAGCCWCTSSPCLCKRPASPRGSSHPKPWHGRRPTGCGGGKQQR
jgi:hypothetical protein